MATGAESSHLATDLVLLLGSAEQVKSTSSFLQHFSRDESYHPSRNPALVVFPRTVGEVSKVLAYCNDAKIPVVPFGAGTGLEGGVIPADGAVCMAMSEMNQIISINSADFDCTVQAGVSRKYLNDCLHNTGLWFPVDPGVEASVGGMCATNASGTNALKYGTMRENVLNLQVVLPSGKIVDTRGAGRHTRKSSAAYNLTNLFIGAEGTLGVITAATLKLYAVPSNVSFAVVSFNSIQACVDAVVEIIQSGIPVARLELLDEIGVDACNKYSKLNLKVLPTLFIEFHSTQMSASAYVSTMIEICKSCNKEECSFDWANEPEKKEQLWKARKDAYYACCALRPNSRNIVTDVCVPISKLPSVLMSTKQRCQELAGIPCPILGHVGDGNFHVMMVTDRESDAELNAAVQLSNYTVELALEAGGTCTGEHGVGLGKKSFIPRELGENTVELMKLVKSTFDPNNIMNPGKIF